MRIRWRWKGRIRMTPGAAAHEGDDHDGDDAENLAATRTLGVAAHELALVFGRQALGAALCIFGIAFAGVALGLRDADPQKFDLPILLTIFAFAALVTVLGVLAAILRKEGSLQARPTLTRELIAMNSRSVTDLANRLSIPNTKVVESLRDAASLDDLRTRLQTADASEEHPESDLALLNDRAFLHDLDVVRVALDRAPLSRG